jgi:superfamily II DNA or RNA helicase
MANFNQIIKSRGLTELPYQKDFLTNPIYEKVSKPVVFAAGTSAGKTFTMAMWLEIFYSNIKNKNKSTLMIPASKTVLRDNTQKSLEEFNPSFTYAICKDRKELQKAIKDKIQVIIALPQTLIRSIDILPKFERFILDEAHQWYFKTTIQALIKKVKPNYQLLLTGSPSRFVAQKDKFICKFVSVMELYDLGHVNNAKIEVVSSSYDFKQTDWLSSYGNLKSTKTNSPKQSKEALEMVINEMINKLKSTTDGKITRNWKGLNKVSSFFNHLNKTIIYTHSIKQADVFYKILNSKMSGKVLLSHSENDGKSELFTKFQNDNDIKILIAIDRGRLGFNMPELFNIVDFTMTQSLDMLLQMYGRLLRKSADNPNKEKIYFKVATKNTADYFVDLMTAMLCLTTNDEPTYYYSSYNGKNMGGIRIPKALINTKRVKASNPSKQAKSSGSKPYVSLVELGIPTDLNLFKQSALHSSDGLFDSIAWTTLDEVRREFFDIRKMNNWTYDDIKKEALKFTTKKEFYTNSVAIYNAALVKGILDEVCSHMIGGNVKWTKEIVTNIAKKYKTIREFKNSEPKAYATSMKYEWINNLNLLDDRPNNWKVEKNIITEAKKYSTIKDFVKNNRSAYNGAKKLNILDKVCKHMTKLKRDRDELTVDVIRNISKKYKKRSDMYRSEPYVYMKALKLKLLDELFPIK